MNARLCSKLLKPQRCLCSVHFLCGCAARGLKRVLFALQKHSVCNPQMLEKCNEYDVNEPSKNCPL